MINTWFQIISIEIAIFEFRREPFGHCRVPLLPIKNEQSPNQQHNVCKYLINGHMTQVYCLWTKTMNGGSPRRIESITQVLGWFDRWIKCRYNLHTFPCPPIMAAIFVGMLPLPLVWRVKHGWSYGNESYELWLAGILEKNIINLSTLSCN